MNMAARITAIALLATAGTLTALAVETSPLDDVTRKEAEATLARGVVWLQTQQSPDGRIGTNPHQSVTALAFRALKLSGSNAPSVLNKSERFLTAFLSSTPTNPGLVAFNIAVCRSVLHLPLLSGFKPIVEDCVVAA